MISKKILTLLIVTAIIILPFNQVLAEQSTEDKEKRMGLNEAIEYAMNNNSSIAICDLSIENAKNASSQANSALRKVRNIPSFANPGTLDIGLVDDEYYIKLTDFNVIMAQKRKLSTIETVKYAVKQAYYGVLEAQKSMEVQKRNMEKTDKLLSDTNTRYKVQTAAKVEVLAVEVQLAQAKVQYDAVTHAYEIAVMNFNKVLGLTIKTKISLSEQNESITPDLSKYTLEQNIQKAFENRLELYKAQESLNLQKIYLDILVGYYPPITYKYQKENIIYEDRKKDLEDTEQSIELDVNTSYLILLNAENAVKAYEKGVEAAKEGLRLTELKFNNGLGTLYDCLKAQTDLSDMESKIVKAQHDLNLAIVKYDACTGIGISASVTMGQPYSSIIEMMTKYTDEAIENKLNQQ